jgi:hypothetical protein
MWFRTIEEAWDNRPRRNVSPSSES